MKEFFDCLDKDRNKLGYSKVRGSALLENEYNQGIEVYIVNDSKLLMTKRSSSKSHPNMWEVPGGCSILDESSIDTALREMKEELGITFIKDDLTLLDTSIYKKMFVDMYISNKYINIDEVVLEKEEVSEIKFVSNKELNKMINDKQVVESVVNRYNLIRNKLKMEDN